MFPSVTTTEQRTHLLPAHGNRLLREALLHLLVVVGLHLDQRRQHVLVVISVLVVEQRRGELRLVDGVGAVEVGEPRLGLGLPQLLELVDLVLTDVPSADLELLRRDLEFSFRRDAKN